MLGSGFAQQVFELALFGFEAAYLFANLLEALLGVLNQLGFGRLHLLPCDLGWRLQRVLGVDVGHAHGVVCLGFDGDGASAPVVSITSSVSVYCRVAEKAISAAFITQLIMVPSLPCLRMRSLMMGRHCSMTLSAVATRVAWAMSPWATFSAAISQALYMVTAKVASEAAWSC